MVLELNISHSVGLFSAIFLIFNSVIGAGWVVVNLWNRQWTRTDRLWNRIYATPSNILRSSGSVGVSLIMWLVGALIAGCGTTVYIELGTVCCFVFCLLNPIYQPCLYSYQGTSSEWRGEKLPRIHLPSSQIHGDVHFYRLYPHNGKPTICRFYCNIHPSLTGHLDIK